MSRTKVESEVIAPRRSAPHLSAAPSDVVAHDWLTSPFAVEFAAGLSPESPRYIARAPYALDAMGGLAEYTGALVLNLPVADAALVAAQRRSDDTLTVSQISPGTNGSVTPTVVSMSALLAGDGTPLPVERVCAQLDGVNAGPLRCVVGAVFEMLAAGMLGSVDGGMTLMVGLPEPAASVVHRETSITAAVVVAVAAAYNIALNPNEVAVICQRVSNHWLGLPIGVADAVCVLTGRPEVVTQLRCDSQTDAGAVPLPDSLELLSVVCGEPDVAGVDKYVQVRTAAFMGRLLIDRIIQHEGAGHLQWDGHLSRISITDYVERFRDRLPTKLRGGEFLDRFGETGDPLTRVDPDVIYRVRSRTEHHIYEHARVCQFAQCLSRAIRSGDRRALVEAGELMYASHWSYGQRCGLGAVNTDLLVSLVRKHGSDAGVLGAKVAGRGSGGVTTIFAERTEAAERALAASIETFTKRTGRSVTMLRGSTPGSLITGARQI